MPPRTSQSAELKKEIQELKAKLEEFVEQYESDMRGDTKLDNGNSGLIGAIREMRKYIKEYPSLLYLLFKKPVPTIAVLVGTWLVLATLYEFGLLRLLAGLFGINL